MNNKINLKLEYGGTEIEMKVTPKAIENNIANEVLDAIKTLNEVLEDVAKSDCRKIATDEISDSHSIVQTEKQSKSEEPKAEPQSSEQSTTKEVDFTELEGLFRKALQKDKVKTKNLINSYGAAKLGILKTQIENGEVELYEVVSKFKELA